MPPSILHAFLANAERTPDNVCVVFQGRSLNYADLRDQALRWATVLRQRELARGERVGLYLGNSPTFLAAYLGVHLAGGVVVLINTQYRQTELRHLLSDSGARIVITDAERLSELESLVPEAPVLETVLVAGTTGNALEAHDVHAGHLAAPQAVALDKPLPQANINLPQPSDLAILGYTSGTTGRSKGAMLSHGNLAANSAAVASAWHWAGDDRLLLVLPLFHIHGLGVGVYGALLTGSSIDLRPRFDAAEVCDALLGGVVTMFFGVPTMYTRLVAEMRQRAENRGQGIGNREQGTGPFPVEGTGAATSSADGTQPTNHRPFPEPVEGSPSHPLTSVTSAANNDGSIRLLVSGSAPLDPQTFAEVEVLFGQRILERYGMTETVMNLTNPYNGERRPGTVGQPFPGQEARIVGVETRQPLPDGEVGEIQVRGPHVFAGYWQRPDATAEAFDAEGWFSTGDLGWRSADGYYTISGRAKELIISGGYNIYPREVEEVLSTHPAVAEVAVVGLPDADLGEQVVAAVVQEQRTGTRGEEQALADELIALCRAQLASYKKPRRVVFIAVIPRNALGKPQKHILREQIAGVTEQDR